MKRIAICKEIQFSYVDGFSSIKYQLHGVEQSMDNEGKSNSVESIFSDIPNKRNTLSFISNDISFEQITPILDTLSKKLLTDMSLAVSINFRDCDISFSSGVDTFYGHSIGRIAIRSNGSMVYRDFVYTPRLDQLRTNLEKLLSDLIAECHYIDVCSAPTKEPTLIVLKPKASAYVVHEVIGHLMEKDHFERFSNTFPDRIQRGYKLFPETFNIFDDPHSAFGLRFGQYDDVGMSLQRKHVIRDGKINELIETHRSASYYDEALYRMCNLYLSPNKSGRCYSDIIRHLNTPVVEVEDIIAGGVDPFTGQFFVCTGIRKLIRDKSNVTTLHPCTYSGNIINFANQVVEVGNDFASFTGICTKNGQSIYVGSGAPTLVLSGISRI